MREGGVITGFYGNIFLQLLKECVYTYYDDCHDIVCVVCCAWLCFAFYDLLGLFVDISTNLAN